MTAKKLRSFRPASQPKRAFFLAVGAVVLAGCNAPISTMRSPYHLRVIEVRNVSDEARSLTIEPVSEHLGAATTFTGQLAPGQVKVLYLYHGFDYRVAVLDESGRNDVAETTVTVDRDLALAYAGDSIAVEAMTIEIHLGEPTFADSLMAADPFGVRGADALMPDTTRGRGVSIDPDEREERERQQDLERMRRGRP